MIKEFLKRILGKKTIQPQQPLAQPQSEEECQSAGTFLYEDYTIEVKYGLSIDESKAREVLSLFKDGFPKGIRLESQIVVAFEISGANSIKKIVKKDTKQIIFILR